MNNDPIHNKHALLNERRALRNNPTPEEALIWKHLKGKQTGYKFTRQHSIENYIVDFYCASKKVAIEIDGAHHFTSEGIANDKERTERLNAYNIKALRFTNAEVKKNPQKVIEQIMAGIQKL